MMIDNANFEIKECGSKYVLLKDIGPWHEYKTITNAAERVVSQLVHTGWVAGETRVFYYDSNGELGELLVQDGKFKDFRLATEEDLNRARHPHRDGVYEPPVFPIEDGAKGTRKRAFEPAFARSYFENEHGASSGFEGLTKLEYFAGQAMQGVLAASNGDGAYGTYHYHFETGEVRVHHREIQQYAAIAVLAARALIEELDKQEKQ